MIWKSDWLDHIRRCMLDAELERLLIEFFGVVDKIEAYHG
jgi:hypothetical protein